MIRAFHKSLIIPGTLFFLGLMTLTSCHTDEEFMGAEIVKASDNFKVTSGLTIVEDSPNFTIGQYTTLSLQYNERVTTTVKYTGCESGATRAYTFVDDHIDSSNVNWTGGHDGVFFFREGEKVKVSVSFLGSSKTFLDTLEVGRANPFTNEFTKPLADGDFEDPIGWPNWSSYAGTLSDIIQPTPSVQGTGAWKFEFNATTTGYQGGMDNESGGFYNLSSDPDSVWFNIYLFGEGDPSARIVIEFKEADAPNTSNQNGRDDGVQIIQDLGHEGWQLFSFKYSSIPFSTVAAFGGGGNKKYEPNRIVRTAFSCDVTETGNKRVIYDFPVFTLGGPFDPSKF